MTPPRKREGPVMTARVEVPAGLWQEAQASVELDNDPHMQTLYDSSPHNRYMRIYLAGGMANSWRTKVIAALDRFTILQPDRSIINSAEYTARDLLLVRSADIVLAYMEADNPSGLGLALEVGYALGLGKTVVLVNEGKNPYMPIVENAVSLVYCNFDEALEALSLW